MLYYGTYRLMYIIFIFFFLVEYEEALKVKTYCLLTIPITFTFIHLVAAVIQSYLKMSKHFAFKVNNIEEQYTKRMFAGFNLLRVYLCCKKD